MKYYNVTVTDKYGRKFETACNFTTRAAAEEEIERQTKTGAIKDTDNAKVTFSKYSR